MAPAKSWIAPTLLEDGFPSFSDKSIDALLSIISPNDTIMLTSSHRFNYSIGQWKDIFKRRGINITDLRILDPLPNTSRKEEILNWFTINGFNGDFRIIDDDTSLNGLPNHMKDKLILTSPLIGLKLPYLG